MRNVLILLVGLMVSGCCTTEKLFDDNRNIPPFFGFKVTDAGFIEYTEVKQLPSKSQHDLHWRAKQYFAALYPTHNPMRLDKEPLQIIANTIAELPVFDYLDTGCYPSKANVRYVITMHFKNSSYYANFSNIRFVNPEGGEISAEDLFIRKAGIQTRRDEFIRLKIAEIIQERIQTSLSALVWFMEGDVEPAF